MYRSIWIMGLLSLLVVSLAIVEPTYTIHYLKSYRSDLVEKNFGCGQSIVYGTYLFPMGPVDALYTLLNANMYGFNGQCQRKDTYIKLFGSAQNYDLLMDPNPSIVDMIANAVSRSNTKKVIIDWKHLPEQSLRVASRNALQKLAISLEGRGFEIYVKAPASYFCLDAQGKRFIIDLSVVTRFIVELYGEETGKYTTFESIFGEGSAQAAGQGYSTDCPRFPTRANLVKAAPGKTFYFEKTMDSYEKGYIGPLWQNFLQKAGEQQYNSLYFLDGHPNQTVDL